MSVSPEGVIELLIDMKTEIEKQLTIPNDRPVNMGELLKLSNLMYNRLQISGYLPKKNHLCTRLQTLFISKHQFVIIYKTI
ncbi:MAG: hypothetical protein ACREBB_11870 [Nitrosotalea sp.]